MDPTSPISPPHQTAKRSTRVHLRAGKRDTRVYLRVTKRPTRVHHRTGKRATRVHLRAGKRAFRVQRARLSFPLIIVHVRRYGESSRGPYHPWGRACPSVRVRLPGQTRCTERVRYAGRREDKEDSQTHRAGQVERGHLLTLPAMPYPALLCPVSRLSRVCHIVNRSATRAPCKTSFCQAILLFSNLSKRYALMHSNLRDN